MAAKIDTMNPSRRAALAVGIGAVVSAAACASADDKLEALQVRLDCCWRDYLAADARGEIGRLDDLYTRASDVVGEIADVCPDTLRGLKVKAHALRWCHNFEPFSANEEMTTDWMLIQQIVDWIVA